MTDSTVDERKCDVVACDRGHWVRGFCKPHYKRVLKHGDPQAHLPIGGRSTEERFWSKVDKSGECWIWTGVTGNQGYPRFSIHDRYVSAHRLSFEWANGNIPDGMVVDHMCFTRVCVRPDHLRLVTTQQNVQSRSVAGKNSTTGARNVMRAGDRFRVRIVKDGIAHNLGTFPTLEEAERVAVRGRRQLFGRYSGDERIS